MVGIRRHALVWLSHAPRPDVTGDASVVDRWHAEGNPFVVCRWRGEKDSLSLGFCLASQELRLRRIAAYSQPEEILRVDRPPSLGEVAALQPDTFARLSDAASKEGLDIRVFGSWMWQTLAGAKRAASFLQREGVECPFKLDGELSFSGLGEVHWREYFNGAPSILVKSITTVRMVRREELWK